ncbi:MAG: SAM-dependent methyltransferase [Pelagibacteraceae bacterium TMED247]|nr:SAM-dependent methyltransferase [Candidatus Pelagibacter sp.]RPG05806.1 MAG: SAM-dependent methyltransferase [Pelagibacteraceae bacterium TMED247]|tara:strand:+ start:3014 stop:3670 length:657 start_codon:yes stop_codon:yes gene_type:complete
MIKNLNIDEKLEKYISEHSYRLHPVQEEIIEYNNTLGNSKKMQISITQAYFFQFLIKTNNIKKILEVGTFTGYSAVSMGLVIPKDGNITCLDINKETSEVATNFFKKANLDKKNKIILGPAINTLKKFKDEKKTFDMVFIDADKENYIDYYNLSLELIKKNGFILIDNVLWKGDVVDPNKNDELTNIIRKFNSFIEKDDRIEKTILPLGDGITICRKI